MSDIKVIEGPEPWEVMKRASEGEDCAWQDAEGKWHETFKTALVAERISEGYKVAIIDTTTPEIEWDKFDWDFFNQYGGLPVSHPTEMLTILRSDPTKHREMLADEIYLRESPPYYWPGGGWPVPDNIEVEIIIRDGEKQTCIAEALNWKWDNRESRNLISFKLTGRVL